MEYGPLVPQPDRCPPVRAIDTVPPRTDLRLRRQHAPVCKPYRWRNIINRSDNCCHCRMTISEMNLLWLLCGQPHAISICRYDQPPNVPGHDDLGARSSRVGMVPPQPK